MAPIPGGVRFTGFVAPSDDTDTYAVIDPIYGIDGWRSVADSTARDAIPSDRRREGMVVVTIDTGIAYHLVGGITNSDWVEFSNIISDYSTQTGIVSGCELSIHPTNDQAVIIASGVVQFLDSYTDQSNPTLTTLNYAGNAEYVITNVATTPFTNIAINSIETLIQQEDEFTDEEKRTLAVIGQAGHPDNTIVRAVGTLNRQCVWQTGQSVSDLLSRIGAVNKDRNDYSGVAGTLTIQRSAGQIFGQGVGTDKNSNTLDTLIENPILAFAYFYLDAGLNSIIIPKVFPNNEIDPDYYNKGGVLTAVPSGLWSVQRIGFGTGGEHTSSITYGREVYDSTRTALLSIEGELFIPAQEAEALVRRYYMVVKQGATDTTDTSECIFIDIDNPTIPQYIDNTNRGIIKFPTITKAGKELVVSLTSVASLATVTVSSDFYTNFGDGHNIKITGANESEYNGYFVGTKIGSNQITYPILGTPASPATGSIYISSLDINWIDGKIYDITSQNTVLTDASTSPQSLNNNAVNYLYWSSGTTLSFGTTLPVEPQIFISKFNVQDGSICFQSDENLLNTQEANLLSGVANVFPSVVTEGLNVYPDVDVTNAFDVIMESGVFYENLHKRFDLSQILSRTTAMVRHFHTGGVWDSDTNAEIDNDNYDDGTNIAALTANRYAKGLFITCGVVIHWIYPREQFTTIADAILADLPEIPPGLVGLPILTAYIQQEGDIAFAAYPGARWIDIRHQGGVTGTATGGSVFSDDAFKIHNGTDNTKEIITDLSNITTGTERTLTMADRDFDFNAPQFGGAVLFNVGYLDVDYTIRSASLGVYALFYNAGSHSTYHNGNQYFNAAGANKDFAIFKNGGGDAYRYDAGTDIHTFNGAVKLVDSQQDNATFFSSVGSVANDGRSSIQAKSTIVAAVTVAVSLTPSSTNPITVVCEDGYIYGQLDLTSKPWININAPDIIVKSDENEIGLNNSVRVGVIRPDASGTVALLKKAGAGKSYLYARELVDDIGTNHIPLIIEAGTLYSYIDRIAAFSNALTAISVTLGKINHIGHEIIGKLDVSASQQANITLSDNWDGDIIAASGTTVNVKIGGNWTGKLTTTATSVVNITCGSRTLDAEDDSIDDASIARIDIKNIGNDYTWSPDRDGATTNYDVSPADTGKIFTNQLTNTLNDVLNFNLPPAAANLHYRFDNVRILTRIINLVLDGTDIFISPTNVQISSTISSGETNSYVEIFGSDLGRWYIVQQGGQWSNSSAAVAINGVTSSRALAYTDVGNVVYNNTSSALTLTVGDSLNNNTSIGSVIRIIRNFGTSGATIQILHSGSAIVKSRANTATRYIANPGATFSNLAAATLTKITSTQWFLDGDISDTAN